MKRGALVAPAAGAAALVVALAAGCTDSSAGTPLPRESSSAAADAESSETSAPARPRELRLDGRDPCAVVPESDWPRFYIEKPGKPKVDETSKSPACFYSNTVGYFAITLVVTEGIEAWDESKRSARRTDVAPVAGFPAIALILPIDKNSCGVAVDVAEGQYLLADVGIDPSSQSQVPELCEYAHHLAESAMKTLGAS